MLWVKGRGFWVEDSGFRVQGSRLGVEGLEKRSSSAPWFRV